jgi:tetratricopeptide (TPR) repeat protein
VLSVLYAYLGRSADARAAIDRSQSMLAGLGVKLAIARTALEAGWVERTRGDPVAAERHYRAGYATFQAMGERSFLLPCTVGLAEALYGQGRFDEAAQMIEEPLDAAPPFYAARAAFVKAKLLARRGQSAAARRLADEAAALSPPTEAPNAQADFHEARAEVERLAGAPGEAAARLSAALRIYEDRRAPALAGRVRTALASLTAQPGGDRA